MTGKVVRFDPGPLRGIVSVPGDKSISHRALIAGAHCANPLRIAQLNPGRDVRATREALVALGTRILADDDRIAVSNGHLAAPRAPLQCMNSGSTARMLLGACAGANIEAQFDGDQSLRRRPMEPVASQLRAFGAKIRTTDGRLPLELSGTPEVQTRHFILLNPSAQVKSALLFAGLFAGVPVRIDADRGSRDHTERLLRYLGATIEWDGRTIALSPGPLVTRDVEIAGDFSSAAFFITAAVITPGSAIVVRDVGVNSARTGLLDALQAMGAAVEVHNLRERCGEPIADITVEHRPLSGAHIGADVALRAIDEIPVLAVAASVAHGVTTIAGVADLRTKESDRMAGISRLLRAAGIYAVGEHRTLTVTGGTPAAQGAKIDTQEDHRVAMAAAVLACVAGPLAIDSDASFDVSYPGFTAALAALRGA